MMIKPVSDEAIWLPSSIRRHWRHMGVFQMTIKQAFLQALHCKNQSIFSFVAIYLALELTCVWILPCGKICELQTK